jgi:hypothetical protein
MPGQTPEPTDLQSRVAAALREAGRLCDEDCPDEAACDAAHPIQASVLTFGEVSHIEGPVDAIAELVAGVVQPEVDRLRTACQSAAVLLRSTADRAERIDRNTLLLAAAALDNITKETGRG